MKKLTAIQWVIALFLGTAAVAATTSPTISEMARAPKVQVSVDQLDKLAAPRTKANFKPGTFGKGSFQLLGMPGHTQTAVFCVLNESATDAVQKSDPSTLVWNCFDKCEGAGNVDQACTLVGQCVESESNSYCSF